MPWRVYHNTTRGEKRKDGTYGKVYECVQREWVKTNKRKPQKKAGVRQSIVSSRFGLIDLYSKKEQQGLICPSGYSLSQCFNVLGKLWHGYHRARLRENSIEKMEKYARAIQNVQKDMGIKTTSFPHLGIYGDQFILNNKNDERIVFEDHSALKRKQEEYEKWQAENSKEIQQHVQKPDINAGEEIETFADDVYPSKITEPEEDDEEDVPDMLEPDEDEGEEEVVMADNVPFRDNYLNTKKTSLEDS